MTFVLTLGDVVGIALMVVITVLFLLAKVSRLWDK